MVSVRRWVSIGPGSMPKNAARRGQGLDAVAQHRQVGRDPGRLIGRVDEGGIEDVGDLGEPAQLGLGVRRVEQVDRQAARPGGMAFDRRPARDPDRVPVRQAVEMLHQTAPDDPGGADHQRRLDRLRHGPRDLLRAHDPACPPRFFSYTRAASSSGERGLEGS